MSSSLRSSLRHVRGLTPPIQAICLGCRLAHQLLQSVILTKAAEGLGFDLAGPPTGNTDGPSNLLKGAGFAVVEPVAEPKQIGG